MSARIGLLVLGLALAIGGVFFFLSDNGNERGAGVDLEERPAASPTVSTDLRAVERAGSESLTSESVTADSRSAVLPGGEPEESAAALEPKEVDRTTVAILSGYVHDELGRPVAEARVLACRTSMELMMAGRFSSLAGVDEDSDDHFQEAQTDANGFFEVVGISPGQPALRITAKGYVSAVKVDLLIAAREQLELNDPIVLDASAIVSGVVLDPNGHPVVGAKVSTRNKNGGIMAMAMAVMSNDGVETAADGTFRLDTIEPEELEVVVTHASFAVGTAEVDAREGGTIEGLEVRLETGSSIRGRVMGMPDGVASSLQVVGQPEDFNPMEGLKSRVSDVADDGTFELWGLKEGSTWNVSARENDGDEPSMMMMWSNVGVVTERVQFAAGDFGVELAYRPSTTVIFRVVGADTGRPLTRLKVSGGGMILPGAQRGSGYADYPDGRVRLAGQRAGYGMEEIAVSLDAVGYEARTETIEVSQEGEVDLGTLKLEPVDVAKFKVIDGQTGRPLEGIHVSVAARAQESESLETSMPLESGAPDVSSSDPLGSGESDADGIARVETSVASRARVTARGEGYASLDLPDVELAGSRTTPITLELQRGSVVNVTATDVFGAPLPARKIEHRAPGEGGGFKWGGSGSEFVTDASGVVNIEHLEPGEHRFRIAKLETPEEEPNLMALMLSAQKGPEDEEDSWTAVEVGADDLKALVLQELPTGRLSGRITEAGKPLKRATLTLRKMGANDDAADEDMDPAEAAFLAMGQGMAGHGGPSVKTERDGTFAFESVAVGSYVLEIDYKKRAMRTEYEVTIVAGDQMQDFDLELAILAGRVVDANGEGVKGALVSVIPFVDPTGQNEDAPAPNAMLASGLMSGLFGAESQVRTIKTRSSGSFELRGVTPGVPLVVHVDGSKAGFQSHTSEPLELGPNESREDIRIVVQLGGAIDVTVVQADGSASPFVLVRLERIDGSVEPVNEMAMGGAKQLTGLTPGTYRVIADDDPDEDALFGDGDSSTIGKVEATVEVVGGETTTLELQLP